MQPSETYGTIELNSTQRKIIKLLKKLKEYGILVRYGSPKSGY